MDVAMVKVATITNLVVDLTMYIGGPSDEPSPILVLCVLEEYRKYVELQQMPDIDKQHEELIKLLIAARIDLSMKIAGTINSAHILPEDYNEKIATLCKKSRAIIMAIEDSTALNNNEFLGKAYKKEESSYYDLEQIQQSGWTDERDSIDQIKKSVKECGDASILLDGSTAIAGSLKLVLDCF